MKRTKGTVNIAAGDELYEISKEMMRLKAEIKEREKPLAALAVRGAKLMKEHGWDKGACDEFTTVLWATYTGMDYEKLGREIPNWKVRFWREQAVKIPKIAVYARKGKKEGK